MKGRYWEDWARIFSVVPTNRKRGNRHKVQYRKFHVTMRENVFAGDRELEQITQRGCGGSSRDIQNLPGHDSVESAPGEASPEFPSTPSHAVKSIKHVPVHHNSLNSRVPDCQERTVVWYQWLEKVPKWHLSFSARSCGSACGQRRSDSTAAPWKCPRCWSSPGRDEQDKGGLKSIALRVWHSAGLKAVTESNKELISMPAAHSIYTPVLQKQLKLTPSYLIPKSFHILEKLLIKDRLALHCINTRFKRERLKDKTRFTFSLT